MLQVQTMRRPSILQILRVSQELKSKGDVEDDLQRRISYRCWRQSKPKSRTSVSSTKVNQIANDQKSKMKTKLEVKDF